MYGRTQLGVLTNMVAYGRWFLTRIVIDVKHQPAQFHLRIKTFKMIHSAANLSFRLFATHLSTDIQHT